MTEFNLHIKIYLDYFTYAIYVQNSIFLSFLKNKKIISAFFDIVYLCLELSFKGK